MPSSTVTGCAKNASTPTRAFLKPGMSACASPKDLLTPTPSRVNPGQVLFLRAMPSARTKEEEPPGHGPRESAELRGTHGMSHTFTAGFPPRKRGRQKDRPGHTSRTPTGEQQADLPTTSGVRSAPGLVRAHLVRAFVERAMATLAC